MAAMKASNLPLDQNPLVITDENTGIRPGRVAGVRRCSGDGVKDRPGAVDWMRRREGDSSDIQHLLV